MSLLLQARLPAWEPPSLREILRWPLPENNLGDRWLVRLLALAARLQVCSVDGLEHVDPANDPFILALNHSTRREALLVPTVLILYRRGRLIHFLADWNYRLIPGVGLLYRRAETITVTRKPARPRGFNILKPLYLDPLSVLERSRACLAAGKSVGIFPEGVVNRDPRRLLPGRGGAAHLSLQTGVPVVPAGICLPDAAAGGADDPAPLSIRIEPPLRPPQPSPTRRRLSDLRAWHAVVMAEIGRLCGKDWSPGDPR